MNIVIERNLELKQLFKITKEYMDFINDNENTKFLFVSREKLDEDKLQFYLNQSNNLPNCIFGLYFNNIHIGNLKLSEYNKFDNIIQIGWLISKNYTGQGFGFKSGKALCEFAFNNLSIRKIELGVVSINLPAIKLYKKLGFKEEGIIRESYLLNNKYYDIIRMGMFKHELVK